jgi:hypothetical protein
MPGRQVELRDLLAMLKECAPAHAFSETDHYHVVKVNGRTYPSLPKKRQIDDGHVRKMARHLGFLECAKKFLNI